jgi:hypothetical protein
VSSEKGFIWLIENLNELMVITSILLRYRHVTNVTNTNPHVALPQVGREAQKKLFGDSWADEAYDYREVLKT